MYGVLSRRHGKILDGDLEEGSTSFSVTAVLPVVESFDLANEIRKQTSGLASHQLTFSHWEVRKKIIVCTASYCYQSSFFKGIANHMDNFFFDLERCWM